MKLLLANIRRLGGGAAAAQFLSIDSRPLRIPYVLRPLVVVLTDNSKALRSLFLPVSSSTINNPSEYIILKLPLFSDHRVFVKTLQNSLNCQRDQDQIQDSAVVGTNCRLQNS
jgi:hypothetical protein